MVPRWIYNDLQSFNDSYTKVCLKFELGQYNLCWRLVFDCQVCSEYWWKSVGAQKVPVICCVIYTVAGFSWKIRNSADDRVFWLECQIWYQRFHIIYTFVYLFISQKVLFKMLYEYKHDHEETIDDVIQNLIQFKFFVPRAQLLGLLRESVHPGVEVVGRWDGCIVSPLSATYWYTVLSVQTAGS